MSGVLGRRHPTDTPGRVAVRYTPCSKGEHTDEDEVEAEIAVVSQATEDEANTSGGSRTQSQDELLERRDREADAHEASASVAAAAALATTVGDNNKVAVNGPRALPNTGPYHSPSDRTRLIGQRLSAAGRISLSSPAYSNRLITQKSRTTSRGSLFDMVTNKLEQVRDGRKSKQLNPNEMGYVNKAHTLDPLTPREIRKQRRKDIQEKFGKKARFERLETSTTASSDKDTCKWTFVFDPAGRLAYWWSFVVSIAFLYNFWVIIYRFAFEEINASNLAVWFTLDYFADFIYVLDIAFHFRTGFLEDGVLQTDGTKLRLHYMNTMLFYIDCLCLLPLDFLYLSIGFKSMLRCFRLVKIYRFWAFLDRTERHTNYPNVVRTVTLLHYLFAVYHWNACLMYLVTKHISNTNWLYPKEDFDVFARYLQSLYWSTLTLTTIGDLPKPQTKGEYIFVIVEFVFGLLLFATILGHIANIVTCISAARKDFQARLDAVKTYMSLRRVPLKLQDKVIKWFDYLWLSKKSSDEEKTMALLPDKLKGEIALHVHLDTLKRVEIFQNTETGFLRELVLLYRPVLFSPGDYICRKGEVGKEMYIVNRGRLQVVADNGRTVLATLRPGSYFGEISILNMGNAGNRRTASVRSVGYSDLFCLAKKDLWEVLKDYPTARVRLEAIAVKRLEKYKKQPLEREGPAVLPRSKSTPGLVESKGKTTLQAMQLCYSSYRHNTLPSSIEVSQRSSAATSRSRSSSLHSEREENSSNRSQRSLTGQGDNLKKTASADMTNSMTVSSITSYITESPAQRSPVTTEARRPSRTSPSPPRLTAVPAAAATEIRVIPAPEGDTPLHSFIPVRGAVPYGASPVPVMDVLDQHASPTRQASPYPQLTSVPLHHHPQHPPASPFSPHVVYSVSPNTMQLIPATMSQLPHIPTSHSMYAFGGRGSPASGSTGSLVREPPSELLLQEITRLRERLHCLESENTAMSHKLNQQQWDVEQRLSEIEMHICGSDSVGSGSDEKSTAGNKESVI